MTFTVSREGTALVTLHGGSETTACDEATAELVDTLESLTAEDAIDGWELTETSVHEHPTAPFDPYTIAVEFTVVVTVEAADADEATARGASVIDDRLEHAGIDAVSYTSSPTASAA